MSAINFALSELFNNYNTKLIYQDITKFIQNQYAELSKSVNYDNIKYFLIAIQQESHAEINYDTVLTINNILRNITYCAKHLNNYKENKWYIQNIVNAYNNLSAETRGFLKNEYTVLSFTKLKQNLESRIRLEMIDVQKYYDTLILLYTNLCDKNIPDKNKIKNIFSHSFLSLDKGNTRTLVESNDYIEYSFFEDLIEKIKEYINNSNNASILKDDVCNALEQISKFIEKDIFNRYNQPFVFGCSFNETLMLYNNINMFIEVMTKYEINQLDDNLEDTLRKKGYSKSHHYEAALLVNTIDSPSQILSLANIIIILSIIYTNDEFQLNSSILRHLQIKHKNVFVNVLSLFAICDLAIDHDIFKSIYAKENMLLKGSNDNSIGLEFILQSLNNMNNIKQFNYFLYNRSLRKIRTVSFPHTLNIFDACFEKSDLNQLYLDETFNDSFFLNEVNKLNDLQHINPDILYEKANIVFCINNQNTQTYAEILNMIINMRTEARVKYFDEKNLYEISKTLNATYVDQYFIIILTMLSNVTKKLHHFWNTFDIEYEVLKTMNPILNGNNSYSTLPGNSSFAIYCNLSGNIDKKFENEFAIYNDALYKQKQTILEDIIDIHKRKSRLNFDFLYRHFSRQLDLETYLKFVDLIYINKCEPCLDFDFLYRHFSRQIYLETYLKFYNIIYSMDIDKDFLSKQNLPRKHEYLLQKIHKERIDSIIKNLNEDPEYLNKLEIDKNHIDLLLKLYVNNNNINSFKPIKNVLTPFYNRICNNNASSTGSSTQIKKKNSESSVGNNIEKKISAASIGYKENCDELRQSHEPGFYPEGKTSTPKCIV